MNKKIAKELVQIAKSLIASNPLRYEYEKTRVDYQSFEKDFDTTRVFVHYDGWEIHTAVSAKTGTNKNSLGGTFTDPVEAKKTFENFEKIVADAKKAFDYCIGNEKAMKNAYAAKETARKKMNEESDTK